MGRLGYGTLRFKATAGSSLPAIGMEAESLSFASCPTVRSIQASAGPVFRLQARKPAGIASRVSGEDPLLERRQH